ncbi:MAG: winged helix-turn-helix domain-containing protein [Acidobacteriia bacterium]|nr:winged helix-turn-helix domain-containing protein [Terriglobia bacterium]
MPLPTQTVRFGPFQLDLRAAELQHNGTKIKLPEQPFQILAELVAHPGEVVTREELRQRLWRSDTFVDFDHGLNTAVKRLRELLGDSAEDPRYIETLPRHGYRLMVPVEKPEPFASPIFRAFLRRRKTWLAVSVLIIAAVVAGVLSRQRLIELFRPVKVESLAVLPLENLSGNPEEEYFADGMTEALITELGKVSALRVISRQSVMQYKGTTKPVPQIAQELRVDAVVEGSALRTGQKVRITTQLVQANPERHLWSESYERDLSDVITLQREVTHAIVREISVTLTPQERVSVSAARTVNPDAYEDYLKGLFYWSQRTPESLRKSAEYFQQSIAKDPSYAPAYASLAEFFQVSSQYGVLTSKESLPKAKAAAMKALALDDSLAEAHAALADALGEDYDWKAAEAEYRRALELNPGSARVHYLYSLGFLTPLGRHAEAIAEMQRAQELDPLSLIISANLGTTFMLDRQFDQAIQQCRRTLEMDPHFVPARGALALAYEGKGMLEETIREMQKVLADSYAPQTVSQLARAYALAGKRAEALKVMAELNQLSGRAYVSSYDVATVYVALGENDRAFAELEHAYDEHSERLIWLGVDWRFDDLHSDPRFQSLLRRMNLPQRGSEATGRK